MDERVNILLVEDNSADVELIQRELQKSGLSYECKLVADRDALIRALRTQHWDVILADYSLPEFTGAHVLEYLREEQRDIPVILVTGSLPDERAVTLLGDGVEDFVIKDRLGRLPYAIRKALERRNLERRRRIAFAEAEGSRAQLRALTGKLVEIRELEGKRIAREIHDVLGGGLTGLKLILLQVSNQLKENHPDPAHQAAALADLEASINAMLGVVRRISTDLRPRVLDDLGLAAAMKSHLRELERRTEMECGFECTVDDQEIPSNACTALFRIFQEAITNVIRHSHATKVCVQLKQSDGALILEVLDNGRGITRDTIDRSGALGLLGMSERALMLGGICHVRGESGAGTSVQVVIPFKRASPANILSR